MKVLEPGHVYELDQLDGDGKQILTFVNRISNPHSGVLNQEVLRAVIDRVQYLDAELPHPFNATILYHLRMALGLHEARAYLRKIEKGQLLPERVKVSPKDGHFVLTVEGDSPK